MNGTTANNKIYSFVTALIAVKINDTNNVNSISFFLNILANLVIKA